MNADLLSCKREAVAMTLLEQPPLDGYIRIMSELWDAKGYGDLGLSSPNFRDQAARLEKTLKESSENLSWEAQTDADSRVLAQRIVSTDAQIGANSTGFTSFPINTDFSIFEETGSESQYANLLASSNQHLHIASTPQIPGDVEQKEQGENHLNSPGCLPEYHTIYKPSMINWGKRSDGLQKPSPKLKAKDHQNVLSQRLLLWRQGKNNKLLREGIIIQGRIGKLKASEPPDRSKVFAKLVLEGQINSALRFLSETTSGGVLSLTDEVTSQLKQKHPNPQSAKLGSLLFGPIDDQYPDSVYTEVNGEMVRQAALRTKGAGGPSGVDANGFRRILASKSFKQSSTRLCEAIAIMTRTLCTQYIDPMTKDSLAANRLIPLDKGEGAVIPIGVGEVLRRIFGKCVMSVVKKDVVDASGSLQLCAGQTSGSEAAIHAMHTIFESDDTDAVLLMDASNAFNALKGAVARHNIRILCPIIAIYAINTYRQPARLFVIGGKEIVSAEGTTQGDPLAMGLYALSIQSTSSVQCEAMLVCR
ncbi:uncharacterized protein LOC141876075 [Acropora palmata]|uniref:uncharacterized protein LOC141876075 n=1 Tax=Acropora palmata TaxID=6131 RepID=UPI003DA03D1B